MPKKTIAFAICFLVAAGFGLFAMAGTQAQQPASGGSDLEATIKEYKIDKIVSEIESVHCKMTDAQLRGQKLSAANIQAAREFCAKSTNEKIAYLAGEFQELKKGIASKDPSKGIITGYGNSYTCYYIGRNTVPTYQDLGLSSSTCSWHDAVPVCKIQDKNTAPPYCLWGCTNNDPLLGWHTKYFANKAAALAVIQPKGYYAAQGDYPNSYTRTLSYGYRYEVAAPNSSGTGNWHVEGPEPNPVFNWYAFINGWWPIEAGLWHLAC